MPATTSPAGARRLERPLAALVPVAGLVLAGAVLFGCSETADSAADPAPAAQTDAPRVLQPGRPGEPARTLGPGEHGAAGQSSYNDADVAFVRAMIPHHAQALEMSALAPRNEAGPRVRALAERIRAAQAPEIHSLVGWLETRGLDRAGASPGGHHQGGHAASGHNAHRMPGMLTKKQMNTLAAAHGRQFDRLYLRLMTRHHEGAVTMARNLREEGTEVTLQEMADDIAVTQQDEISILRKLLAD